jgi:hypothetical protein
LLFFPGSWWREGEGEATAAGRTGGQNIAAQVASMISNLRSPWSSE